MHPPTLDCHAHVAPDVTMIQLKRLDGAVVFAVTRTPQEAQLAAHRSDSHILWGCGLHPARAARGGRVDIALFRRLVSQFALVGEVGLDRRSGNLDRQTAVLRQALEAVHGQSVIVSLHSAGCADEILDLLEAHPHRGYVLHWFTGDEQQLARAIALGCYFSVNMSMRQSLIRLIPTNRLLPETDFPVSRVNKGGLPGDTRRLEGVVANLHETSREQVRITWYRNLRALSLASGAIDRMPGALADLLLVA